MNIIIFKYLNSLAGQSHFSDQFFILLAGPLSYVLMLAAVLFLFFHSEGNKIKKAKEIIFVFIVAMSAWVLATLLKNLIHTARPYDALSGVIKLVSPDDPFAFPSGHATFFGALSTSLYLRHKKVGLMFFFGTLLIVLSRIIVGIHFPGDILGGLAIGSGIALLVDSFFKKR